MAKGSGTRSGLLWEVERLLEETEELPQVLLMENVPQVIGKDAIQDFRLWQQFLEQKGYTNYVENLNAKDYGVAQNRNRTFMVSLLGEYYYEFPKPIKLSTAIVDYLEEDVDKKFYLSEEYIKRFLDSLNDKETQEILQKRKSYTVLGTTKNKDAGGTNSRHWVYDIHSNISTIDATTHKQPKQILVFEERRDTGMVIVNGNLCGTLRTIDSGGDKRIAEIKQIANLTINPHRDNPSPYSVYDKYGISPTLTTMGGGNRQPMVPVGVSYIRKLTPKECWRLMGFSDEDFHKAEKHNSNSQLYKQAGNSIVVNVLEGIFKSLKSPF